MALNIYTGSLGDTSRGSRYRNQALSAHPPNQIKRPSKQSQIVAGALARPTAFLGGLQKVTALYPLYNKTFGVDGVVSAGVQQAVLRQFKLFCWEGGMFFSGAARKRGQSFYGPPNLTIAILAQGTHWAVAVTQALFVGGSNPPKNTFLTKL